MRIKSTPLKFGYYRGEVLPMEQAKISIASNSLQYGTVVFGGVRGYLRDGVIRLFRLEDHFKRLMNGIKICGIEYSLEYPAFLDIIERTIKANKPEQDFYIRPFVFSDTEMLGPHFDGLKFDLAVYLMAYHKLYDPYTGLKLMISTWRKYHDDMFPTKAKAGGCYLNSALAQTEATKDGFDDAIMLDTQGCVAECTGANVFIVKNGECIFPDTGFAILEGITRATAITLLQEGNFPIRFGRVDRSMAYSADEFIMTGTAAKVLFAESIEGRKIGTGKIGPVCQYLVNKYEDLISGNHPRSEKWNTTIKL